jgi:hypothetical protein
MKDLAFFKADLSVSSWLTVPSASWDTCRSEEDGCDEAVILSRDLLVMSY